MTCQDGKVQQRTDGRWYKCIGGDWSLLPTSPLAPIGGGTGVFDVIDFEHELDSDELRLAVRDPRKQVIVKIIELDEREGNG